MASTPSTAVTLDPLGEALHSLRISGVFYTRSHFSDPWGLSLPPLDDCLMFHMVTAGSCWVEVANSEARQLSSGDFALVPHGAGHLLRGAPGVACPDLFDLSREAVSESYEILRHGGGGEPVEMICGAVRFDHPVAGLFLKMLPPLIAFCANALPFGEAMSTTLGLIAAETVERRPGGEAIVTRLADVLIIQAVRAWIDRDPVTRTGWLGALRDPQIGRAITLIHRHPAHAWSLGELAEAAALSRSAFAARFASLVGVPPIQYLAHWRMGLALSALKAENVSIATLAERFGYQSEVAFSRTFKRITGSSPGSVKQKQRYHSK